MGRSTHNQTEESLDGLCLEDLLARLFASQNFAVVATQNEGQPYANLVAFAATEDLKSLLFITPRATRKFANLSADARVALIIDNRTNNVSDLHGAVAVMAIGRAEEVGDSEREDMLHVYLSKHPHLKAFATSPSCALLRVRVEKYDVAGKFQNVMEYHVTQ